MRTTAHSEASPQARDIAATGLPSKPPYNVVIAYDEFASGRHAVETCHRLIAESQGNFTVRVKVWSFAVLRNQVANLTAATDAAKAQMVMVATSSEDLPAAVKKWMDAWLAWNGGRRAMLVAILDSEGAEINQWPAETYLRAAAANGNMEFLLEKNNHAGQSGTYFPRQSAK